MRSMMDQTSGQGPMGGTSPTDTVGEHSVKGRCPAGGYAWPAP